MNNLVEFISKNANMLILSNASLLFLLLILSISNKVKINKLVKKYYKFMNGVSEKNVEEIMFNCIDKVEEMSNSNVKFNKRLDHAEKEVNTCVQKVGVIRFNAFENVGSDLSFSIALLDNNDNGVVLSGIYNRDSSNTYAKQIENGKSKYTLSTEEIDAIDKAKKNSFEGVA